MRANAECLMSYSVTLLLGAREDKSLEVGITGIAGIAGITGITGIAGINGINGIAGISQLFSGIGIDRSYHGTECQRSLATAIVSRKSKDNKPRVVNPILKS